MPAPWEAACTEKAVVWDYVRYDKFGKVVVADVPREIWCRWEDGETTSGPGQLDSVNIDASLMTLELLITGSKVWRGELKQLAGTLWEDKPEPLMVVATVAAIPDEKGEAVAYTAGLSRHKDSLPSRE